MIRKLSLGLAKLSLGIAGLSLMLIIAISFSDIIARYFLGNAIEQKTELVRVLLALSFVFSFPLVCFNNEHICVDLLDGLFSQTAAKWRDVSIALFGGVCLAVMSVWVFNRAARTLRNQEIYDELNMAVYPVIYLFGVLLSLSAIATGIYCIRRWRGTHRPSLINALDKGLESGLGNGLENVLDNANNNKTTAGD